MALPPLIVVDDDSYALDLLEAEQPGVGAIGAPDFIELVTDREDSHLVLGHAIPSNRSWNAIGIDVLRRNPDLVLVDWSLFSESPEESKDLVATLRIMLDTGHRLAVVVQDAATDELDHPAEVIESLLKVTPEIYHSEF